ncbi:hypothetical protein ACFV0C_00030 [Streptomyces sp. NPDC059568]
MAADMVPIATAAAVYFALRLTAMLRLKALQGPFQAAVVKDKSA